MSKLANEINQLKMTLELADDKSPSDVALVCRQVLEQIINLVFEEADVKKPAEASLVELINNSTVKAYFNK